MNLLKRIFKLKHKYTYTLYHDTGTGLFRIMRSDGIIVPVCPEFEAEIYYYSYDLNYPADKEIFWSKILPPLFNKYLATQDRIVV